MEKKKSIKISLSTFFLVIAIIVIIAMAYYMYFEKENASMKIAKLEANASNMQNTINDLQNEIESISNTTSGKNTNSVSNGLNVSKSSESAVTEKQTLEGMGYTITLYSNNEVKITPIIKDLNLGSGETIKGTEGSYSVTGLSGNVEKMYQGNNGMGIDPMTFFIMEDGTVQYVKPLEQISNNNNTIPTTFKIDGKIENLNNVVDLKANENDVIIAITKDGKEIKCWNEWNENM